ncbi:Uncharacterized protein PECH_004638 [Penicillium ucsense]|uniref:Clr5 domain-containing protein n=1 Tax=Penicillium ucsense TaxID=2839758 RepID=A0A8J8WF66_9EURO|nr:Uncharacterized protein PECM_004104 [Penicillium ucsense]KAF7726509.1 Uncharacterized protein PECH_004638 [Penicillium ucsense]
MVYEWADKREICYQMYIQERKSLEYIMSYMKTHYNFGPSKRAYQTQFSRWEFPSKQNPAHKNASLVARVGELWEQNTGQRDMLRILVEEGFTISERELMRVRSKNGWLLRVPNGMKPTPGGGSRSQSVQTSDEGLLALQQEVYNQEMPFEGTESTSAEPGPSHSPPEPEQPAASTLSPEVVAKRKERFDQLQMESDERWASRKRRRRTRGWAGLPADPPGPPRYPSETTIEESKQYLNLDNKTYRHLRAHFQKICEREGVKKKTIAGDERWQAAKDQLIQDIPHLQHLFSVEPNHNDARALALDVVCTDVTKRMRTLESRMSLLDAKVALGVNPAESRQIRDAFYDILRADHFTSKLEAGEEHWADLKARWIQGSLLLQQRLQGAPADPDHALRLKAAEVLCRDVMKRFRDDQTKRDPARKRSTPRRSSQAAASSHNGNAPVDQQHNLLGHEISNGISTLASQALASAPISASELGDMQIDPSLLQAANDPTSFSGNATTPHEAGTAFEYMDPMLHSTLLNPVVWFQSSPQSQIQGPPPKPWTDKLATRSVEELRQIITSHFPYAILSKIEGMAKDENDQDTLYPIDEDHELDAYLSHVFERKAEAVFLYTVGQI